MIFRLSLICCIISIASSAGAQNNQRDFSDAFAKQDTAAMHKVLSKWERENPNDPECYTSYFNYFIVKGKSSVVKLDAERGTEKSIEITDSADQVVGYIHDETLYNPVYVKKGIDIINKGIAKFPNRLDMRFGKIYILGEQKEYDAFATEIVTTINYSSVNTNKWLWTKDEPVKDAKNYLLDNIQTYVNQLFDIGDPQAKNIRRIADASLKIYPDHTVSLSNLAISYIFENNYKHALVPLLQAEKQAPGDVIVLGNIAYVYTSMNDNKKAIEYYEKVMKHDQGQAKAFAESQIKKLKPE